MENIDAGAVDSSVPSSGATGSAAQATAPAVLRLIRWFNSAHPLRCFYCGSKLASWMGVEAHPEEFRLFTWDHYIPQARGGRDRDNKVPCCRECNLEKKDKLPDEWLEERKKRAAEKKEGEGKWVRGMGEFWAILARKDHSSRCKKERKLGVRKVGR